MKKVIFRIVIGLVSILAFESCSSKVDEPKVESNEGMSELVVQSKEFGAMHNDCLNYVLDNLKNIAIMSRSQSLTAQQIKELTKQYANMYAHENMVNSRTSGNVISEDVSYEEEIDIPKFESQMTAEELAFVKKCIELKANNESLSPLMSEVENSNLAEINKVAVMNFIATLEASTEYWNEFADDWIAFLSENLSEYELVSRGGSIDVGQVAFADAYYAWWGTLGSGMNLAVGACIGAVGSGCSVLNQL